MKTPRDIIDGICVDVDGSSYHEYDGRRVLSVLRENGYAVVPVNPTPEMLAVGDAVCGIYKHAERTWRKMIDAAHSP